MAEERNSAVNKAGWGCLGCGLGIFLCLLLTAAIFILGICGLAALVNEHDSGSSSPDDPENLEEEYVMGGYDDSLPKIAVVDVRGVIVSDENEFGGSTANPRLICTRIRRAAQDKNVKALIVNLNTPGGEVVASDEIYAELKRFRQTTGKPAVALMHTMAASGGYYVAAACHPIVANKLTMTGSIGVIISTYNYRGLFDKLGLQAEVYTSGRMKDMLNGARMRTPEEIQVVQGMVAETYGEFVRIVSESRKIPAEKIRTTEIGDGRVLSGEQALKLGLVDSLGYFRDAVKIAAKEARLKKDGYTVIRYKEPFSFGRLFSLLSARSGALPVKVSVDGAAGGFTPRRGQLYYLPAGF